MAKFLFLLEKHVGHLPEGFGGIDCAGGVVRRVDEHGLNGRGQHLLERVEVDLEVLRICRHDAQRQPRARRVRPIFRKERREGQNFVAGLCHQPECVCQRAAAPLVMKMSSIV